MVEFDEANEICLESFYDDPSKKTPPDLKVKLDQNFPNIIDALTTQEDPSHRLYHTVEGVSAINLLAPILDLDEDERKKAEMSFRLHDLGYKAVAKGLIAHKDHHLASLYFAGRLVKDKSVLSAVYHHNKDVLPFDTPLWARLARDVDRVLVQGAVGLSRLATFLITDPDFKEVIESGIVDGKLADIRHPLRTGFGKEAREFFKNTVFPYFKTTDQLVDLSLICKRLYEQVYGLKYSEMRTYPDRVFSEVEIQREHLNWQVEPVIDSVYLLYRGRIMDTHWIRGMARDKYNPPEGDGDFAEVYLKDGSRKFITGKKMRG